MTSFFCALVALGLFGASLWNPSFERYAFWLLGVAILGALWEIERAIKGKR